MSYKSLIILLLLSGCSPSSDSKMSDTTEKISLVEYTYREMPNGDGFEFYLASLHEFESDGSLTALRRDSFDAPLQIFKSTINNLTEEHSEILNNYPTDTSLINYDIKESGLSNRFGYMLLLTRENNEVTVIDFSPRKAEGALKIITDTLLQFKATQKLKKSAIDTVSLISTFDSLARKHVLPLHPLPPNSLPAKVYKRKQ